MALSIMSVHIYTFHCCDRDRMIDVFYSWLRHYMQSEHRFKGAWALALAYSASASSLTSSTFSLSS